MQKTAWIVAATLLVSMAQLQGQRAPSLDAMLARLDAYLIGYERDLSAVVADETFVQEIEYGRNVVVGQDSGLARGGRSRRRLTSEIAFFWLNGEMDWLGFRSVLAVDGKPVDRPEISFKKLLELLGTNAPEVRWMITEASKHNLGNPRTINTPNLALDLLHRRNRRRFNLSIAGDTERISGRQTCVLQFDEFQSPTTVKFGELGDLASHVRAWVDVENGSLWRTEVRLTPNVKVSVQPLISVEFRKDKSLGILVPVELNEEFIAPGRGKGRATYSNFRRFETSGRILPQQ